MKWCVILLPAVWWMLVGPTAPASAEEPVRVPAQVDTGLAGGFVGGGGSVDGGGPALTWESALFAGTSNMFLNVTVPIVITTDGVLPRTWDGARDFAHALRVLSYRGESDDLTFSLFLGEETLLGEDGVARHLRPQVWIENPSTLLSLQVRRRPVTLRLRLLDVTEPRVGTVAVTVDWPPRWRLQALWWGVSQLPVTVADGLGVVAVDEARGVVLPAETRWFSAQSLGVEREFSPFLARVQLTNLDVRDPAATGGLLAFGTAFPWRSMSFLLEAGVGGDHWVPWPLGPFFLVREVTADLRSLGSGRTLSQRIGQRDRPGWGALVQGGLELDEHLTLRAGAFATPLERTVDGAVDAFLGRRFLLSAHGAWDTLARAWTFSVETRFSFNRHWFLWGRAASQFVLDAQTPEIGRIDLVMLGVGIRTRLE